VKICNGQRSASAVGSPSLAHRTQLGKVLDEKTENSDALLQCPGSIAPSQRARSARPVAWKGVMSTWVCLQVSCPAFSSLALPSRPTAALRAESPLRNRQGRAGPLLRKRHRAVQQRERHDAGRAGGVPGNMLALHFTCLRLGLSPDVRGLHVPNLGSLVPSRGVSDAFVRWVWALPARPPPISNL